MSEKTAAKNAPAAAPRQRQAYRQHPGSAKVEAILSVWCERRRPAEVCREMGINWQILNEWQSRALQAMIQSLEPRTREPAARPPALSQRLRKLLDKQGRRSRTPEPAAPRGLSANLTRRLAQASEAQAKTSETAAATSG